MILVTESITPRPNSNPEIRYQPSMLSLPSAAATVAPEQQTPGSTATPKAPARRKLWFFTALAVVAGVASAGMLGDSKQVAPDIRSGSPGFKKGKDGKNLHWHKKALTVHLDESLQHLGPGANEAVMQAFGRWVESDSRLPDLSFDTGGSSAVPAHDGKSTISYGRITTPGHERDLAITVTYAQDSGEIVEADIVLNSMYPLGVLTAKADGHDHRDKHDRDDRDKHDRDDRDKHDRDDRDKHGSGTSMDDQTMDCQNRYDVQNVTTHEVGHFFGLGEDVTERDSAMFQTIDQCEVHKRSLAPSDISAVGTLYAETEDPEEAAAGARACSFGGAPAGGGWAWISAALVGLSLVRRRR